MTRHITRCIDETIRKIIEKQKTNIHRLTQYWQHIVGDEFKRISEPIKITHIPKKGTILKIAVTYPRATEMIHNAPQIIEKINTYYGYQAITDIIFVNHISHQAETPIAKQKIHPKKNTRTRKHNIKNEKLKNALDIIENHIFNQN